MTSTLKSRRRCAGYFGVSPPNSSMRWNPSSGSSGRLMPAPAQTLGGPPAQLVALQERRDVPHRPEPVGDPRLHGRRAAERLVDADEVVMDVMQRERVL